MQFHVLHAVVGAEDESDFEREKPLNRGEPIKCPECSELYGMMRWLPPYRVSLNQYGSTLGDAIFDAGDELLVSRAFVVAWLASGLEGLDVLRPVEVISTRPGALLKTLQPYFRVELQPTKPRVDWTRSMFIGAEIECMFCGDPNNVDAIFALRIDESSWTGEDIFVPWGAAEIIVTQNVIDMVRTYGLTNVTTTPLEEYRWDPLRMYESIS